MRSLIIYFCLLAAVLYIVLQSISSSSPSVSFPGRRLMREPSLSSSTQHGVRQKAKGAEEMTTTANLDSSDSTSMAMKHASSNNDANELLYHVDYHGVTTHPTPTPKHPAP